MLIGRKCMLANARLQTIICSSRLEEAEPFYREVLGLPLRGRSIGALVFDVGGGDLRVSPVPPGPPPEHTVAGFRVDDVVSSVRQLAARGVAFALLDHLTHDENGIATAPDGSRVAWFSDPDGNMLSIVQYAQPIGDEA